MSIVVTKDGKRLVRPAEYRSLLERNGFKTIACGTKELCKIVAKELD